MEADGIYRARCRFCGMVFQGVADPGLALERHVQRFHGSDWFNTQLLERQYYHVEDVVARIEARSQAVA